MSKGKFTSNFSDLFDDGITPEPTTTKQFDKASKHLADEALEMMYNIMHDPNSADYVRFAAAKSLVAYGRGTPINKSEAVITAPQIRPIVLSGDPEDEVDEQ